jgi:hypothetical protein
MLFAQDAGTGNPPAAGNPDPNATGVDTAQQNLKEISVEKFEHDGYWRSYMSYDDGYISSRLFEGNPAGKQAIPEEEGLNIPDRYVLGARIDFLRRGYSTFILTPEHPISVEGITKTLSIWVAGRNYNHELKIMLQDFFGRPFELSMGKLNFQGWKQLIVAVPPYIVQRDYHYSNHLGIKIVGLKVECDPADTSGVYYVYFDDLRAVTDLFAENTRDPDDMEDAW